MKACITITLGVFVSQEETTILATLEGIFINSVWIDSGVICF